MQELASVRLFHRIYFAFLLLLLGSLRISAVPANDDFASAIIITNFPAEGSGDTTGGTAEPGEPAAAFPPQTSIWWKWTPSFTGRVGIANDGSVSGAWLKVFTGTELTSLTNLVSRLLSGLTVVNVTNGMSYYISVDINLSTHLAGPIHFRLLNLAPNDNFADALPLTGEMDEVFGDNTFSTMEAGEPDYSAGSDMNSIWWKWTAPRDGPARISSVGSFTRTYFHIFTGTSLTNLVLVAMGDSWNDATINATAGTIYWIRIAAKGVSSLGIARVAVYPPTPPNDAFENRTALSGNSLAVMGTANGATAQSGDPVIWGQRLGHTVWYEWTADTFGRLNLTVTNFVGVRYSPRFRAAIFTGNHLARLHSVASGLDTASTLVEGGQTCVIGVDSDRGDFRLSLEFEAIAIPSNDDFANRLVLSGTSMCVTNDNTRATRQRGEREPFPRMAEGTLWYEWTAPLSGYARVTAEGSGFHPVISVWQGRSLPRLKLAAYPLALETEFEATAGETYLISVDGYRRSDRGKIILSIDLTTLQILSPSNQSTFSAGNPPLFQINSPSASADGQLLSVAYFAVGVNGSVLAINTTTNAPFSLLPTNLVPGKIVLYAFATNAAGAVRKSAPVIIKVRPGNDDFSQALPLAGYTWETSGYSAQATREYREHTGGRASTWWQWCAPANGRMEIVADFGEIPGGLRRRRVDVYTGSDVAHLKRVRWTKKTKSRSHATKNFYFDATQGTTYYLAVVAGGPNYDPGLWPFRLRGTLRSFGFNAPLGESYIEPVDVLVGITNCEEVASIERVDFLGADGYTNDQLIASVAAPPYQIIWSNALPGDYTLKARLIKLDGTNPPPEFTTVSVRPLNDNFTNRIVLQTNFAWLSHRIAGATREPDEPVHNGKEEAASAWWTWSAPADGKLYISDPTKQTSADVALYTGTNLASLQPVALHTAPTDPASQVTDGGGGTDYQFAIIPGSTPNANLQLRFYPPPPNDDFAQRTEVSGSSVLLEGYTVGATREPDEPYHAGFASDHTVWWSWTAPGAGSVTVQQQGQAWTLGGFYTGTNLATLQPYFSSGSLYLPSTFETTGSLTFQIALVSYWGDLEHIAVDVDYTPTPTNDAFGQRTWLAGTNVDFPAFNWGATTQPEEPPLAPGANGRTLWWSWTAPADGNVYVTAQVSFQYPHGTLMLQAFTGDTLDSLQLLQGGGGDRLSFRATSNQTYHVRFDSAGTAATSINLLLIPAPANDDFTDAILIAGSNVSLSGTSRGASIETNEPSAGVNKNTVWYSWTAPSTDSYIAAANAPSIQAFTGSELSTLVAVGTKSHANTVVFNALAGTVYHFQIAGSSWWEPDYTNTGPFLLWLFPGQTPANDDFADAESLIGTNVSFVATNWAATLAPDDPPFVEWNHLERTIWYQWQAPASGLLQLTDLGSTVPPATAIYLGTNLNQLWMIGTSEAPVRSNELVHLLVDGYGTLGGVLNLGLVFSPAPTNDEIEQAIPMAGTSFLMTANVRTATGDSPYPGDRHRYDYRDAWWSWTAPGDGSVIVTNLQPGSGSYFFVYTGSSTNLQIVAYNSSSTNELVLRFEAIAETNYYIRGTWGAGSNADNVILELTESLSAPVSAAELTGEKQNTILVPLNPVPPLSNHPRLKISSPRVPTARGFAFQIAGKPGQAYRIEYSRDLTHWEPLRSGVLTNETQNVLDTNFMEPARFYRVLLLE